MTSIPTITINMDAKCAECPKKGCHKNDLCTSCTTRAISGRKMKTPVGRAVQLRFFAETSNLRGRR